MKHKLSNIGFTLIELLVVVLIIGILASVAVPKYFKQVERAKSVQLITFTKQVADAQKRYFEINSKYAQKYEQLDVELPTDMINPKSVCLASATGVRLFGGIEININNWTTGGKNYCVIEAFWASGKYRCSGFVHNLVLDYNLPDTVLCLDLSAATSKNIYCPMVGYGTFLYKDKYNSMIYARD